MAKRQLDTSFSLFCQTHAQSKPYSVALKASIPWHVVFFVFCLGFFSFLAILFWFWFFSELLCLSSQVAAALWCVLAVLEPASRWHEMRKEYSGVHSADCTASFFSYIPTIEQFFLFCLIFFPPIPLQMFPSQDIFTFYSWLCQD